MLAHSILVTLVGLGLLVSSSTAGYVLQDDYSADQFFSMFDFFTDPDPTGGYVQYVDQNTAQQGGLINNNNGAIYMGVEHANVASGSGRQSVRLTSKKSYTHGLIVLDLAHMPGGICGTWPAFWTVGPNWPTAGEIDIIEGVNSQLANSMALHTGPGCSVANDGLFSGQVSTPNCDVKAAGQPGNAGCAILTPNDQSYGSGFNQGNGGVYATEWTSQAINIYFFPRGAIPSDLSSGANPDPTGWGQPMASFSNSGCDIDEFFNDHQIVFDTTFCGDWAGAVWTTDPVCSSKAPTCEQFVQNNPSAFQDAFWTVNSLKVFQSDGGAPGGAPPSGPPPGIPGPGATVSASVSLPFPSPPPSGVPPVVPQPASPPTTSGFPVGGGGSGGGGGGPDGDNGRHTRTFGTWGAKFVAVPSATGSAAAATATATVGPPLPPVSDSAAIVDTTSESQPDNGADADTDKETYTTVTALSEEDFHPRAHAHRPRRTDAHAHAHLHEHAHLSRREDTADGTIEPRSASMPVSVSERQEEGDGEQQLVEAFKTHLSRRRRHLFRHAFPQAGSE
ncbi:endo-1,3(4)-beta-glucanase [Cladophialophora yegresii CBS 114405]|uniref:endo-1,3(4)-beta-glucanase n=1 Tax=Cladophialophora yegresii CBS 114405 TaxID=1182544 RepID=W9VLK6_9EURO|nr:endo-1,3(4)-beta-glucanase [Cladophialophora yegresii CBS 114405]EXJ56597.1 endo-1,3(4)-beta-glucanase [Cladophialophora yegresii CBS 114405]